jgi:pyruvate carboxylase
VAIYSPADRLQSHRYNADEAYCVGTPDMAPVSCYLDVESIIKVAKAAEVDAVHPGYGFLSENTTFARRCAEEGITFIGPRAETIEVCVRWCGVGRRRAVLCCGAHAAWRVAAAWVAALATTKHTTHTAAAVRAACC